VRGRLTLHCGFPKTATTTLQTHVFPHIGGISYLGQFCDGPDRLRACLYELLRRREEGCFDAGNSLASQGIQLIRQALSRTSNHALISCEEVLASVLLPRIKGTNYSRPLPGRTTLQQLTYMKDLIEYATGLSPRVLIAVREQSRLLPSFYAQAYRNNFRRIRGFHSFSSYLDNLLDPNRASSLDATTLDFSRLEDVCFAVFGKENTAFLAYEWLENHPPTFSSRLALYLGVPEDTVYQLLINAPRENVRRNGREATSFRVDRPTLAHYATNIKRQVLPGVQLGMGSRVNQMLGRFEVGRTAIAPTKEEILRIKDYYRNSNATFVSRHPEFGNALFGN
jgi:hypothetical protein